MSDPPSAVLENASLLALSLSLLPAPDRDLLKHLAPLTSFDQQILDTIAHRSGVAGDATLARLAEDPSILKVRAGRAGTGSVTTCAGCCWTRGGTGSRPVPCPLTWPPCATAWPPC